MNYTPVLLNFLNTHATSYLQFFQTFSIHLSLLGPPPKKADDETDTSNYRPISLLSNVNRIFENIMYGTMTDFIKKYSLFIRLDMVFVKLTQPNMLFLIW